jgi:hypothetical protein
MKPNLYGKHIEELAKRFEIAFGSVMNQVSMDEYQRENPNLVPREYWLVRAQQEWDRCQNLLNRLVEK